MEQGQFLGKNFHKKLVRSEASSLWICWVHIVDFWLAMRWYHQTDNYQSDYNRAVSS